MLAWKLLIIAASATAALALGLSAQAAVGGLDLQAMVAGARSAVG
jgi:hypothetical protein